MCISEALVKRWELRDVTELDVRGNRRIYSAESGLYGPVILKMDHDPDQLNKEYRALASMGASACKVYALEEGILMEERILPGTSLRENRDWHSRLEVLASLWETVHGPANTGESYLDWVERAGETPEIPEKLGNMGKKALDICRYLFQKYPERMLLHGDLHHDNILLRAEGTYAVIDPKGVVGPCILDLPRFLLNEPRELVLPGIRWLSHRLSYPVADLCSAYYLEAVLANLWFAEDKMPLQEDMLNFAETLWEEFHEYQNG